MSSVINQQISQRQHQALNSVVINLKREVLSALRSGETARVKELLSQASDEQKGEWLKSSLQGEKFEMVQLILQSGYKISEEDNETLWEIIAKFKDPRKVMEASDLLQANNPNFKRPTLSLIRSLERNNRFGNADVQQFITEMV